MALTQESLVEYFATNFGIDPNAIGDDTPLFSSALINSFSMMEVILFIEGQAGIRMNPSDINLDNLDSISNILAFVEKQSSHT